MLIFFCVLFWNTFLFNAYFWYQCCSDSIINICYSLRYSLNLLLLSPPRQIRNQDLKFIPQSKNLVKILARLTSTSTAMLIFEEFSQNQNNLNFLWNIGLFDFTRGGFLMPLKYLLICTLIDRYDKHRTWAWCRIEAQYFFVSNCEAHVLIFFTVWVWLILDILETLQEGYIDPIPYQ